MLLLLRACTAQGECCRLRRQGRDTKQPNCSLTCLLFCLGSLAKPRMRKDLTSPSKHSKLSCAFQGPVLGPPTSQKTHPQQRCCTVPTLTGTRRAGQRVLRPCLHASLRFFVHRAATPRGVVVAGGHTATVGWLRSRRWDCAVLGMLFVLSFSRCFGLLIHISPQNLIAYSHCPSDLLGQCLRLI